MNASTISTDRWRFAITFWASVLTWDVSLFESAAVEGRNDADADKMDVNKNDDWARTNDTV